MTVKAAGKISYSQFLTAFLLKNLQTKLTIAQIGKWHGYREANFEKTPLYGCLGN